MPRLLNLLPMIAVFFLMAISTPSVGAEQNFAPQGDAVLLGPIPRTGGHGMAYVFSHGLTTELSIADIPLSYVPPLGTTIDFKIGYDSVRASRQSAYAFSNFGPCWHFNWISYLTLDTAKDVEVIVGDGKSEIYKFKRSANGSNVYAPSLGSQAKLVPAGKNAYQRKLPDGSVQIYDLNDGTGRIFMTRVVDPQGNTTRIEYDKNYRISAVTDSIGQKTIFKHQSENSNDLGFYKIAKIVDPFGRSANVAYDSSSSYLVSITDSMGLVSRFTYEQGSYYISSLATPYGTSTSKHYTPKGSPAGSTGLRTTLPNGDSTVLEHWAGNIRETYKWNITACKSYPSDPENNIRTHCFITRWLADAETGAEVPVQEFTRAPLEDPITYSYEGQTEKGFAGTSDLPIRKTRKVRIVTPDGSAGSGTQTFQYQYNSFGRVTQEIDPVGRTFTYKYADNDIDLLEKRQTHGSNNELLGKWEYNDKHRPAVSIDGSGQRTRYEYNGFGELTKLTDANNNKWTAEFDSKGFLSKIVGPLPGIGDLAKFTYDNAGRRHTQTDAEGHTVTLSYDDADRVTSVTYADGSSEQVKYDKLDAVVFKDRAGRETKRKYNSMDQLVSIEDALGRMNKYSWCACGSQESLTDPAGHTTTWKHDLEGRLVGKRYDDGTTISYVYENGGDRIQSRTDAMKQTANYAYNLDGTLAQVSYINAVNPTSPLNVTYDPDYPVIASLQNNLGTIKYEYNHYLTDPAAHSTGAGSLRAVSNSTIPNSAVVYQYDALGHLTERSISGANNSDIWKFDAMGRIIAENNALGEFHLNYGDSSAKPEKSTLQLSSINYPNGLVTHFSYNGSSGETRLQEIKNANKSSGVLSLFDYRYDAAGEVTKWKEQIDGKIAAQYSLSYDPVGQLKGAINENLDKSPAHQSYHYDYDLASNRTVEKVNGRVNQVAYNNMNELISLATGETAINQTAGVKSAAGSDPKKAQKFSYDANGNLINDGTNTYKWDAENRLLQIAYPGTGNNSQFTYNAAGECVKIVETAGGKITNVKQFIWCGGRICEERDGNGVVVRKLFALGENIAGKNYYFTRDHLGSTREVTDSTGTVQSRFDYDPFGHPTVLKGISAGRQYAGYYTHKPSGLNLTLFRAYNSNLGRWISRDPVGEFGLQGKPKWSIDKGNREVLASNLYAYVGNNSIKYTDPLGLADCASYVRPGAGVYNVSGGGPWFGATVTLDSAGKSMGNWGPFGNPNGNYYAYANDGSGTVYTSQTVNSAIANQVAIDNTPAVDPTPTVVDTTSNGYGPNGESSYVGKDGQIHSY